MFLKPADSMFSPSRLLLHACSLAYTAWAFAAIAQDAKPESADPAPTAEQSSPPTLSTQAPPSTLPDMVVSEPKLGQDLLRLPLSATVADSAFLDVTPTRTVRDAAIYSPNTFITEFTARKLSTPLFRGIGGSPLNPGVTTYYDRVPQFHGNSASLELLDVAQVDIVRGPQGALFGRNTIGGLISVTSRRPSLSAWGGEYENTVGDYGLLDFRGRVTGPLVQDELGFSFAGGYREREGYTGNTVSGNDLDSRSAFFGKGQFLWLPDADTEIRFIITAESADDGDYGLTDLAALRLRPFQSARDFEGSTQRDVIMPTLQITRRFDHFDFSSTTGYVWWETTDTTDLDYSAFPFATRFNSEQMSSFTQEFRFANPAGQPLRVGPSATLAWQTGLFLFRAEYDQLAFNALNPPVSPIPGTLRTFATARLVDHGLGAYAQGTLTLWEKLDLTAGLRFDYEAKEADLGSLLSPALAPATSSRVDQEFGRLTPQAAVSYRLAPAAIAYFNIAGGYKAGGFNPAGPAAYQEETSWNYEFGIKGTALDDALRYSVAAFYTDWRDLQLNQPLPGAPGQFFIANAGDAVARGIELEAAYQVCASASIFGGFGWQDTQFLSNASDSGVSLAGRTLPYAPDYTLTIGGQVDFPVTSSVSGYARADLQFIGAFNHDAQNRLAQQAYSLLNLRLGARIGGGWFVEAFVNNALDTEYIPLAFAYPFAPSGFVGENGAPATFGIRAGVKF